MSKIRIPVEELPPPNISGNHLLRFRIVSDSKNKVSEWSSLYELKSIGQYRPYESDVAVDLTGYPAISLTWDTPIIYNFSESLSSASIAHNHSQNFKKHDTDIWVSWDGGDFQYHEKTSSDSTLISSNGNASIRAVGLVSTHGFDTQISGAEATTLVNTLDDLFLIFDTGVVNFTL